MSKIQNDPAGDLFKVDPHLSKSEKIWLVSMAIVIAVIVSMCFVSPEPSTPRPTLKKGLYAAPRDTTSWQGEFPTYGDEYVTLHRSDGAAFETGMTGEEILNQLDLDYQDLYDYYGGAEELY